MPRKRPIAVEVNPINRAFYLKVQEGPIYFVAQVPDQTLIDLRNRIDMLLPREQPS